MCRQFLVENDNIFLTYDFSLILSDILLAENIIYFNREYHSKKTVLLPIESNGILIIDTFNQNDYNLFLHKRQKNIYFKGDNPIRREFCSLRKKFIFSLEIFLFSLERNLFSCKIILLLLERVFLLEARILFSLKRKLLSCKRI